MGNYLGNATGSGPNVGALTFQVESEEFTTGSGTDVLSNCFTPEYQPAAFGGTALQAFYLEGKPGRSPTANVDLHLFGLKRVFAFHGSAGIGADSSNGLIRNVNPDNLVFVQPAIQYPQAKCSACHSDGNIILVNAFGVQRNLAGSALLERHIDITYYRNAVERINGYFGLSLGGRTDAHQ